MKARTSTVGASAAIASCRAPKECAPVWCTMCRPGILSSSLGAASIIRLLSARAPWLPPKTSRVGGWLRRAGREKNAGRTGTLVTSSGETICRSAQSARGIRGKGDGAVGVAGDDVGLKENDGDTQQHGGHGGRSGHIAAHADDHLGAEFTPGCAWPKRPREAIRR